jgi:uncharacterized protein YkwD
VFAAINRSRAEHHVGALSFSGQLVSSAHSHNLAMAGANEMSHQVAGEADLSTRISRTGASWNDAAENVGWTTDNSTSAALALHNIMMGEGKPPAGQTNHYSNIVNPDMHSVGIDVIWDPVNNKLWLTEDFTN